MTETGKILNKLHSPSDALDFRILFVSEFVSDLEIRISNLFRWLLGGRKFLEVLLTNISKGRS